MGFTYPRTDSRSHIDVLNYLDRNNIAVARLGSFERDLGLHGTQYNTIISIFFVGYILTQVPTNMILDKVKPSVFLPAIMCCWGVVSACSGAVQIRFCLGFVEAPFFREYVLVCHMFLLLTINQPDRSFCSHRGTPRKSWRNAYPSFTQLARWQAPSEGSWAVPSWVAWMVKQA